MTPDDTRRTIADLDAALTADDPAFAARFRRTIRRNTTVEILSFALLAAGAVLSTTGLAAHNRWLLVAGAGALVASAALTMSWRHALLRPRNTATAHQRRRRRSSR